MGGMHLQWPVQVQVGGRPRAVADGGLSMWEWVCAIYAVGVGVMGMRIGVSMWRVRGMVRRGVALEDSGVRACLVEARRVMGVGREVPVVVTEEMGSPALVGWWRPVMVVPRRLIGELSTREWEFIFLHECAHLKRNDVLVNYWMAVLGAVHWFNPVAWVVWPRVRADRELACDEQVVMATGEAGAYGETLLKMFDGATRLASPPPPAAVGVIGTKAFFKRRIQMIAAFRKTPGWVTVPAVGLLLAVGAATLTSAVTVVAADVGAAPVGVPIAVPGTVAMPVTISMGNSSDVRPKELDVVIAEVSADQQPLGNVLEFLADTTHLNMAVNWQALEGAAVDKNTPVTVKLKSVPLHKVLDVILSQVREDLGYEFSDNVLTISTNELLPTNGAPRVMEKVVRVYNVRDLVEKAAADASTPVPGAPMPPAVDATTAVDNETGKLQGLIMSTVEPMSWTNNGGAAGSMQSFHGLITVTATQGVQDKVAALLEDLRKADKEGVKK